MSVFSIQDWVRQPRSGIKVNLANPLLRGFQEGFIGSDTLRSLAGVPLVFSAAKQTYFVPAVSPAGLIVGETTTNKDVFLSGKTYAGTTTTSFTSTVVIQPRNLQTADISPIHRSQNIQEQRPIAMGDGTNAVFSSGYRFSGDAATTRYITDTTTVVAGNVYVVSAVFNSGTSQKLFVNGRLVGTSTDTRALSTALATAQFYSAYRPALALFQIAVLSDEEIAQLHANPWQIFTPFPRTIYSFSVGGAHTVALNQVSETDAPQAFTGAKRLSFGQNAESDSAQAVVHAKSAALAQISETDASQAFSHAKQLAFGQTSETDAAQPIQASGSKIIALAQVSETDAPQIFVSRKQKAFGQPSEADASAVLSPGRLYPFSQASETDAVQAFAKTKRAALNEVSESDTAQPIQAAGTKVIALGQVTESEFAQALAHFKALGILQASETDDVFAMAASKAKSIGQAQETDTALNFGGTGIPPYEVLATAYQPRTRRAEYEPRVKRIPR